MPIWKRCQCDVRTPFGYGDDLDLAQGSDCTQHVQTPDRDDTPSLPLPLACDLGPQDGQARLLRWQTLHQGAAPTARLQDGELEVRYPPGPGVHAELVALADAEQECCSFVRWTVTEVAGGTVLRVIAPPAPPEAVEPIAALFGGTRDQPLSR